MRTIWNKGHRIRASDKHLVYHFSIGTLLFVFVAVLLLLNIKQLIFAYRLGAFQLVREQLDDLPLQLHNHTDSDWCLCIGRFSVLPLLLRQFQEAPAPSKAGKNDTSITNIK